MYYKATVTEISTDASIDKKVQSRIKTPKLTIICGNLYLYVKETLKKDYVVNWTLR